MKSTEIIQEGPLDFVKRVGAGIGGMTDPNSTFKTGYQQAAGAQQLDAYAKKTYPAWNQAVVNFKQQGVPDPQLGPEMQDWATEYFGVPAPAFSGPVSAQSSMEYLKKLWAMKMSPRKAKAPAPEEPAAGGAAMGAMANQLGASKPEAASANTMANAPVSATNTAKPGNPNAAGAPAPTAATPEPAAPAAPAADPAHAMFKDPAAFKAEWDKFIASKPNYKLIADPKLLSTLKNMWMRTGGMKAESKKNKGKSV